MTNIYIGAIATGKTHKLVQEALANPKGVLIVGCNRDRELLRKTYAKLPIVLTLGEFLSPNRSFEAGLEFYIDDVVHVLDQLLATNLKSITINEAYSQIVDLGKCK